MAMVCPQCDELFEQRLSCPQCGVRLLYKATRRADKSASAPEEAWQHTPWGRLVVGLLLAQGLYYVLRHICTAGLLFAHQDTPASNWATLGGLILHQSLQIIGILAAGLLTGAGQRRGFFFGALLGVWNGVFFVSAQRWLGHAASTIDFLGEPILQAAFGAVGGMAGSLIWKPAPTLEMSQLADLPERPRPGRKRGQSAFAGPVAWGRVLTGITIAVGGVIWSDVIREFVVQASEGKLKVDTELQALLVTWEIAGVAILAGSAMAGATTKNGLKQGFCVGLGSMAALLGIRLAHSFFALGPLILTLSSALCLSLAGGWFGGQLLPPVDPARRRRPHMDTAPLA
jgi:DNA-directed RNA polymerase subunit RPC12/RpoP